MHLPWGKKKSQAFSWLHVKLLVTDCKDGRGEASAFRRCLISKAQPFVI